MLDDNTFALLGPLAVGAVLVLAGVSKLHHGERLSAILRDSYQIGSARVATGISLVLPAVEVLLGFLLLAGLQVRVSSSAAVLLLLMFSAMLLRQKRGTECGCGMELLGRGRAVAIVRNFGLVSLLLPSLLLEQNSVPSLSVTERLLVGLAAICVLVSVSFRVDSATATGTAVSRRSFLRLAMASAVVLVPALYPTRNAEAACYGCRTCSQEAVLLSCSEVCCTFLVRDREYCDTGCTPCSGWRQEVHC